MDIHTRSHAIWFRRCYSCAVALMLVFLVGCASDYQSGAGNFNTVIVDAGHGGFDRGARSVTGVPEKDLALDTSRRLAAVLRRNGFNVVETRKSDYFITLGQRVAASNSHGGAIFVSVHYNWSNRRAASGVEIYYHSPRSRRLAANILRQTAKVYPTENRGVKRRGFYVLRNNRRPAVLCELGFLSSPSDNRYLQNPSYRQRLAERIAAGIIAERQGRGP